MNIRHGLGLSLGMVGPSLASPLAILAVFAIGIGYVECERERSEVMVDLLSGKWVASIEKNLSKVKKTIEKFLSFPPCKLVVEEQRKQCEITDTHKKKCKRGLEEMTIYEVTELCEKVYDPHLCKPMLESLRELCEITDTQKKYCKELEGMMPELCEINLCKQVEDIIIRTLCEDVDTNSNSCKLGLERMTDMCEKMNKLDEGVRNLLYEEFTFFNKTEREMYKRALQYGEIDVIRGRIVVVGKDGVGKTCLIRSVLQEIFEKQESTRGVKVTSASVDSSIVAFCSWKELPTAADLSTWSNRLVEFSVNEKHFGKSIPDDTDDLYEKRFAKAYTNAVKLSTDESLSTCDDEDMRNTTLDYFLNRVESSKDSAEYFMKGFWTMFFNVFKAKSSNEQDDENSNEQDHHDESSNEKDDESSNEYDDRSSHERGICFRNEALLTFWDHGGQEVYFPAHSALLGDYSQNSIGIYLIVFNQAELLNDTASSFWRNKNEAERRSLFFFEKNSDYLFFWMTHITIAHPKHVEDGMGAEEGIASPPTFLIGTHSKDRNAIRYKRRQVEIIDELVKSKSYQKHLVQPQEEDTPFWSIENSHSGKPGKDPGAQLRIKIKNILEKYWQKKREKGIKYPLRWLQFERVLLHMAAYSHVNVTNLHALQELANVLFIPDKELPSVLKYLNTLGVILHYPEIKNIEEKVFLNPQWLIRVIFSFITAKKPLPIYKKDWDLACEEGNVSRSLAQYFLTEAEVAERDKSAVLTILEHLDVVSNSHPSLSIEQSPYLYVPYLIQKTSTEKPSFWTNSGQPKTEIPFPLIFAPIDLDFFPEPLYFRLVVKCLKEFPDSPILLRNYSVINAKDFTFELTYLQKRYVVASVSRVRPHMNRSALRSSFSRLRLFLYSQLEQARQNGMKGFYVEPCFQPGLKRAERVIDGELAPLEDCLDKKAVITNRNKVRIWGCPENVDLAENVDLWKEVSDVRARSLAGSEAICVRVGHFFGS